MIRYISLLILLSASFFSFSVHSSLSSNSSESEHKNDFTKIWNNVSAIRNRLRKSPFFISKKETFDLLNRIKELGKANDEELELINYITLKEDDCQSSKLEHFIQLRGKFQLDPAGVFTHRPLATYIEGIINKYRKVCDKLLYNLLKKINDDKFTKEQIDFLQSLTGIFHEIEPNKVTLEIVNIPTDKKKLYQRGLAKYLSAKGFLKKKLMMDAEKGRENFKEVFDREIRPTCHQVVTETGPLFKRFIYSSDVEFKVTDARFIKNWWIWYRVCANIVSKPNGSDLVYDYWRLRYSNPVQRGYYRFLSGRLSRQRSTGQIIKSEELVEPVKSVSKEAPFR